MGSETTAARRVSAGALAVTLLGTALVLALPGRSEAAVRQVAIRDNVYDPKELHVDPGDTVVWTNHGSRTHTVTSDDKEFNSGRMTRGDSFSHTFNEEGYFFYHCNFHGSKGQVGQWGVVVVGNPPPPEDAGGAAKDERPKLVVPDDFATIQKAVNAAKPGSTVVIKPGVYKQKVVVQTPRLVIKGVDRFRTILHGEDKRNTGITVDGTRHVTVKNLTVRNYTGNGVFFNDVTGYTVNGVDAIKNRTYGIYAFDSYDGVIKNSFAWGSGDAGFYIGQCLGCSGLIQNVVAKYNYIGYSGTNATGVIIRDSVWKNNGLGIVPNTLPTEELGPNRGTFVFNNLVANNNYKTIPGAGISEGPIGLPMGTGIFLPGVENNVVLDNVVKNHDDYGILISQSIDENPPINNTVRANTILNSDFDEDGYGYDLAWDGNGSDNCFAGNHFEGETGPPDIETVYACENRPFAGVPYPPVIAHLAAAVAAGNDSREQKEPPEPQRPRCQRGAPGCHRH